LFHSLVKILSKCTQITLQISKHANQAWIL